MIVKYQESDASQLSNLVKDFPMVWGKKAAITVIAFKDSEMFGVGSLSRNPVHPHREYINIFVQAEMRKKGVGKAIFQKLFSLSESKKFQAAVSSKDTTAISFLENCGFHVARKCYTPVLKKLSILRNSDKIKNFFLWSELTSEQQDEVIKLQLENYHQFHQLINPLSETISFDEWKNIVKEDLISDYSFVWSKEGKIKAYLFCYEGESRESIDIGYIGGRDVHQLEAYLSFYKKAVDKLFTAFRTVEIEADDVDVFAFALLNCFEYDKNDSWDTYLF